MPRKNSTPSHPRQRVGAPGPEVATPVQGRFKRGSGAAGDPESREPVAGPHQAAPITGPGEQTIGARAEAEQDTVEGAEHPEKRSGRSRLRGTLNRRRATGMSRF